MFTNTVSRALLILAVVAGHVCVNGVAASEQLLSTEPVSIGSNRAVRQGCPAERDIRSLISLLGRRAEVQFLWQRPDSALADRRFPFYLDEIQGQRLLASPVSFPKHKHYLALLNSTGHIAFFKGRYFIDICSAVITAHDRRGDSNAEAYSPAD